MKKVKLSKTSKNDGIVWTIDASRAEKSFVLGLQEKTLERRHNSSVERKRALRNWWTSVTRAAWELHFGAQPSKRGTGASGC